MPGEAVGVTKLLDHRRSAAQIPAQTEQNRLVTCRCLVAVAAICGGDDSLVRTRTFFSMSHCYTPCIRDKLHPRIRTQRTNERGKNLNMLLRILKSSEASPYFGDGGAQYVFYDVYMTKLPSGSCIEHFIQSWCFLISFI